MDRLHIAQFGTYDIESLGDTMFPKMFQFGIEKYSVCDIELFSMNECIEPYNDNSHVYSFEQFEERNKIKRFDFAVIGGGEFLHYKPMVVIIDGITTEYPGGYIWKRPIELANENNVPIIFNCVGVPYDFTENQQKEIVQYCEKVECIAVRDIYSYYRLERVGIPKNKLLCVADNNWYFNQAYPKELLNDIRMKLFDRLSIGILEKYIIVQYGTTSDYRKLAIELIKIEKNIDYPIFLMPVNYCHEDIEAVKTVYDECLKQGSNNIKMIDEYLVPIEMMAIISGAYMFCGTSLHGNLTAASYGVRFVGLDMYKDIVGKMDGIFSLIGMYDFLLPSVDGLYSIYLRYEDNSIMDKLRIRIEEIQMNLDSFYEMICNRYKGVKNE